MMDEVNTTCVSEILEINFFDQIKSTREKSDLKTCQLLTTSRQIPKTLMKKS